MGPAIEQLFLADQLERTTGWSDEKAIANE